MDKSPEAFRTISEVADFLDTPAHVLRFWESRFPQIRPVKRAGGRRYYRPGDVALLAGIKKLLHDEGLTIRGVQKILREQGIRHVAGLGSGDGAPAYDDSDVEAVLSAEYGPQDLFANDDQPSAESLQSAQIISLETALNRHDQARAAVSAQPELWPPAPPDEPAEPTEVWPHDPEDTEPAENLFGNSAETEPADQVVSDVSDPVTVEDVAADMGTATKLEPELQGADAGHSDSTPKADDGSESLIDPVDGSAPDAETAPSDSQTQTEVPDVVTAREPEPDAEEGNRPVTVATLLRRTSPDRATAIQPDLIRLRDRLMALREQVAEAARRRAK